MKKIVLSFSALVISITICSLFVSNPAANAQKSQSFVNDKSKDKETVSINGSASSVNTSDFNFAEQNSLVTQKNGMTEDYTLDSTLLKEDSFLVKAMAERVNSEENICFEIACYQAIHDKMEKDIETFFQNNR